MKKITAEWLRKAEADYRLAVKLSRGSEPFQDQLCFHCQQAAEKYLKSLLVERGKSAPRIHILRDLLAYLLPQIPSLRSLDRGLKFLTRFAVAIRYPGDNATKRQSESALRWAKRVRSETYAIFGVKRLESREGNSQGPGHFPLGAGQFKCLCRNANVPWPLITWPPGKNSMAVRSDRPRRE